MTQLPRYLTPRQVAETLTEAGIPVTEDAARRWARESMVESVKLPGGQYFIPRSAIDAILAGKTPAPAEASAA